MARCVPVVDAVHVSLVEVYEEYEVVSETRQAVQGRHLDDERKQVWQEEVGKCVNMEQYNKSMTSTMTGSITLQNSALHDITLHNSTL